MKKILVASACLSTMLLATQNPYEVSLTVGGTKAESDLKLKHHTNYGIRFGIENSVVLENIFDTVELVYERSNGADYKNSSLETDVNRYSVNFLHSYKDFGSFVPYGLVGVGYEDFSKEYLKAQDSVTTNIGVGVKYYFNEAVSLRAEVRDQINLEHSMQHELIYTFGLGYAFGASGEKNSEDLKSQIVSSDNSRIKDDIQKVHQQEIKQEKTNTVEIVQLDSDKDGVVDENDKCPNTLEGFRVDSDGCPIDYTFDIHFGIDKHNIEKMDIKKLEKFISFMSMMPNYKVVINGHTDSSGSDSYNMKLSKKRANTVMNKLIELGLDKNRVSSKGYGESNPIASNDTAEGKLENRRVEAEIIK